MTNHNPKEALEILDLIRCRVRDAKGRIEARSPQSYTNPVGLSDDDDVAGPDLDFDPDADLERMNEASEMVNRAMFKAKRLADIHFMDEPDDRTLMDLANMVLRAYRVVLDQDMVSNHL